MNQGTEEERPPLIPQAHPWLLIHHGKKKQLQTFYSISEDRCYVRKIPELCNKIICASTSYGWLVLEYLDSDECFLFNPVSTEKIQLPLRESAYDHCILTSSPTDPDCRVIFINKKDRSLVYCKPGDNEFNEESLDDADDLHYVTTFEGKVYGLTTQKWTLVVLDFSGPRPRLEPIIMRQAFNPVPVHIRAKRSYVIESCGELLLVTKMLHGLFFKEVIDISIIRVDLFHKTWVKVKSIGDRAIFLDIFEGMSFSIVAGASSRGISANCIYFTQPHDRCLYVLDLENRRISTFLPSPTVSRSDSSLHWVMIPPVI